MKTIPLTQGYVALVDDADYSALSEFKWFAHVDKKGKLVYAARNIATAKGQRHMPMHRQIVGDGAPEVDHWDGDGLNNQRVNLRPCNQEQNQGNRGVRAGNMSLLKGVGPCRGQWRARIHVAGKPLYLGIFEHKRDAGLAYDAAARDTFGEFARLNFPFEGERAA